MATIKKTVNIYVPLMPGDEYEATLGGFDKAINELIGLSGSIEITFNNIAISPLCIKRLSKGNKEIKGIFSNRFAKTVIKEFLRFSSEIQIHDAEQFEKYQEHYMSFEFFMEKYVILLLIYLNLAKPGAFDTREGILKIDELHIKTDPTIKEFPMLANTIAYSVGLSNKYKWPPIKELSIKETLKWLNQHWHAFESISDSSIQRALNAFSYLFHQNLSSDDNSSGDLFHSLIGLEALYVTGNINIQGQVNQKSQLLLGKRNDFKKVFNELYDYRSRYIHGQLNFINKFFVDDKDITINQLLNTYEQSAFAIAILVSSIQKHIEMDKNEFVFELILSK